ncbi:MAG: 3-deoxy-manno-octulosonate cytidylyltransferase [Rhodanobacteraceae bacterium]|nr:3-deoxy-manno-octulosonate cytidylyltransferase [Rhodanobacteraceae bacterium]HQW80568.1 3-deoxy-manno-octulosonate cytidylyltransferase [Pseudomonadota bacterium]
MTLEFSVAIPARFGASRLPGKPLRLLNGQPMILHVVDRALAAGAAEVVVATDDERIAAAVQGSGATVCMTRTDHPSGTDRLAEVAQRLAWPDQRIVINLQGDEPLAPVSGIRTVAETLAASAAAMATLATPLLNVEELFSPNCVKLVRAANGDALYFSRAPIPWARDALAAAPDRLPEGFGFLRHIGIYGYRAGFLRRYVAMPVGTLERIESLEQLRVLEAGERIAVALAPEVFPAGVDTEADLARVEALIQQDK